MRNQSRGGRARRLAASSIAVTLVATALIVTYFRAEVAAYVTRYTVHEDRYITEQVERELAKSAALMQEAKAAQAMTANAEPQRRALEEAQARAAALASELAGKRREIETQAAQSQKAVDEAMQQKQAAESHHRGTATIPAAGAKEDRRPDAGGQGRASDDGKCRATTPRPRRGTGACRGARERACGEQAARSRPRPRSRKRPSMRPRSRSRRRRATVAELRQSLEQEQKKTAALTQEAKAAQAMTATAEPQRRALEEAQARAAALASELAGKSREIETQAAQSQKAVDAATKQKQAAESTIAELRQSLQQEQKKTAALMQEAKAAQAMTANAEPQRRALEEAQARAAALASELAGTRREIETQAAQSQKAVDAATQQKQAAESHHRGIATIPAAGAKEDRRPDAGGQGRAGDDGKCRATAPRARRGTGACRGTRERACGNAPRDRDPGRAVAKGCR